MHRRHFTSTLALSLLSSTTSRLQAQTPVPAASRNLRIGCATLAWNVSPTARDNFELAVKDISELGYWGFETVGPVLEAFDTDGTLRRLMDKYQIPLRAVYVDVNVTDPGMRKEHLAMVTRVGKLIRKYGGNYLVVAVNNRRRMGQPDTFDFAAAKSNMVAALNDYGSAAADVGLRAGIHSHTGTVIEKREEVYGVMEAVNTTHMAFAPDVGQIQKSGLDAAQIVRDLASVITHMHLKDFSNGKYMAGYCPLGMGVVDIDGILKTVESAGRDCEVMHELDRGNAPMTARETAAFGKAYLTRLGYKFRS